MFQQLNLLVPTAKPYMQSSSGIGSAQLLETKVLSGDSN